MSVSRLPLGAMRAVCAVVALSALVVGLSPSLAHAADRGAWAANVAYAVSDVVSYSGVS